MSPVQDVLETKIESTIAGMVMGDSEEDGTNKEDQIRNALKAAGVDEDRLNELGITVEDIANGSISKNDLAEMGISRNILDGINQQSADNGTESPENIEIPRDMQISAIENADIPSVFKNLLLTNNNSEIYDKLGVTEFVSYVSAYMAKLIINVAAFLLTFIVVSIILRAIIFSLNVVSELPVVGLVNRLAGGVLGMLMVLIIVWLVFLVITMLCTTGIGQSMIAMIQENEFLKTIYEYNPVLKLATSMKL